jgi:hypothetical protein
MFADITFAPLTRKDENLISFLSSAADAWVTAGEAPPVVRAFAKTVPPLVEHRDALLAGDPAPLTARQLTALRRFVRKATEWADEAAAVEFTEPGSPWDLRKIWCAGLEQALRRLLGDIDSIMVARVV